MMELSMLFCERVYSFYMHLVMAVISSRKMFFFIVGDPIYIFP